MALHLHRSERADRLAAALADVLAVPPADPFAREVVAVPAKGVERWLTQRLSHVLGAVDGAGVCANVDFPSPGAVVARALATVTGIDARQDPWAPDRLVWPLLEVIDGCVSEQWCSALGRHLGMTSADPGHRRGRRLTVTTHLARLYDAYSSSRPQMIRAWAGGNDLDGAGERLPDDLAWQAELWRRLRTRVGTPSPAERLEEACALLVGEPGSVDLPERLSLFGPTRLSTDQLAVLNALGAQRDVHLWLPHPSPVLWQRVQEVAAAERPVRRRSDPTARAPKHPLLASLGRDARELQTALGPAATDTHHPVEELPDTLLGRLQQQLRDDAPPTSGRVTLAPDDRSVQVHACHGRARQVEVLREVLLGLLDADATLEPRDVLVMCPDIETFAPLVSATFGLAEGARPDDHPGHRLRVRLADRALRQTNPLLATVAHVLDLADARVTASQVLDLAATPPVRRRFRFDDDDLEKLQDWVVASGVRWGLDRQHRTPFGLETVGQNTWEAGLDRILLGAAMSEDDQRWVGLALPLDDVESNDIERAGRLAELVERLAEVLDRLTGVRPVHEWLGSLALAIDLLTHVSEADSWQLSQARRELATVAAAAEEHDASADLTLPDIRALLADRLRGRPTRASFRTGNLTMCSMVPMRSVPHRVVCLLGVDDGVFPRGTGSDGDDILLRDPCVGERDRRSEDRQLLLDAIFAAREHLVILYSGAHERTNAERPPAVPVGEILDALDRTACAASGGPVSEQVVLRHPLQPFDIRNFTPARLGLPGPFSYDRAALAGAVAASGVRRAPVAFLDGMLERVEGHEDVELEDLIRFVEHPVKAFLRQRLDVAVQGDVEEVADALAIELAPLEKWTVGDSMLSARLAGGTLDDCLQAEWRRGVLPPGALGKRTIQKVCEEVEPLVVTASGYLTSAPRMVDVAVALPDGRSVTGTVGSIHDTTIVRGTYSRLGAKHRLRAWVQLLALQAAHPATEWSAVTLGRGRNGTGRTSRAAIGDVAPADAGAVLAQLVDLYDRGMRMPLPLPPAASEAYAWARHRDDPGDQAHGDAVKEWNGGFEKQDASNVLVWGPDPAPDLLMTDPPLADETWHPAEPSRFGVLACRLWFPLFDAESVDAL